MKFYTALFAMIIGTTALAVSYTENFTGFLPGGTDVAAASGSWTSDTGVTLLSSTDPTQLAAAAGGSTALLEVGSNSQLAVASTANHRVTTTMRLGVVRATSAPTGNATDHLGFYVDDSTQNAYIWHNDDIGASGDQWLQLTGGPTIADAEWINLTFVQDYTHDRYTVTINGTTVNDVLGYSTAGGPTPSGPWFNMVQVDTAISEIEIEGSASAPTYVDSITVDSQFIITADDHGAPGDAGDSSGDAFTITPGAAGFVELTVNGAAYINGSIPDTEVIVFEGTDDGDTLTLNYAGGTLPANIIYNGNAGTDALNITGNSAAGVLVYTPTSLTNGTVTLDGTTITFTGLDPITQTGTLADVVIEDSAAGAHAIVISQFSPTQTQITCSFESITFTNPTNSFTLNANADVDSITTDHAALAALDAAAAGALTIDGGGAEADTLTIDAQGNPATDDSPATANGTVTGTAWVLVYADIDGLVTLLNNIAAVPALDFWGILILSLSLLICGLRKFPGLVSAPVSGSAFRTAAPRAGFAIAGLYALVLLLGSPATMWDCIGLPIVFMLTAYLVAWFAVNKHSTAPQAATQ
jgi:hypothetical protein